MDLTCGKDHPTAHLLHLVPGRSGTVYKNWPTEREKDFRARARIPTLDPFQGKQEHHRLACSKTQPACWTPFTSSSSPVMPLTTCAATSSKTRPYTAGAQAVHSIKSAISCAPHTTISLRANKNNSAQPSRQMRHI